MDGRRITVPWGSRRSGTDDVYPGRMDPQRWFRGGARSGPGMSLGQSVLPRDPCYGRTTCSSACRPLVNGGTGGVDSRKGKKVELPESESDQDGDTGDLRATWSQIPSGSEVIDLTGDETEEDMDTEEIEELIKEHCQRQESQVVVCQQPQQTPCHTESDPQQSQPQ